MGACAAYIYIRGEFVAEAKILEEAIFEAYKGKRERQRWQDGKLLLCICILCICVLYICILYIAHLYLYIVYCALHNNNNLSYFILLKSLLSAPLFTVHVH